MRLRATVLGFASVVALLAPAARALTIEGRVLQGTKGGAVPGVTVQLHVIRGDEELKGQTALTSAQGDFRFADLKTDPALSYYLATEYQNAFYTEGPISQERPSVSQNLTVYDVGRDLASVTVTNHHIIVERQPDGLHVNEILIVENKANTAYLGTGPEHAENAGIRLGLPASVREFQPGMGGDPQTSIVRGRELSSLRPIPPGVHPFSFTYHVPLSGRVDLSHRLYFPTSNFVVLLDDPKLKVDSNALHSEGMREQGGKQYAVYSGEGFKVGQEVTMRIGGAGFLSNPGVYPWLAAPFLIAAALWFARRSGRRAPAPVREAPVPRTVPLPTAKAPPPGGRSDDDFRKAYLYLIAALDEGLEHGDVSRETHALIRQNLKRRLQALLAEEPASGVR